MRCGVPCGLALGTTCCHGTLGYLGYCFNCISGCPIHVFRVNNRPTSDYDSTYRIRRNLAQNTLVGGSNDAHDIQQLILVVAPAEEWYTRDHFRENAAARPDVDRGVVRARAKQNIWSAVPQCHDLFNPNQFQALQ